jgi:hypothetical protein
MTLTSDAKTVLTDLSFTAQEAPREAERRAHNTTIATIVAFHDLERAHDEELRARVDLDRKRKAERMAQDNFEEHTPLCSKTLN